MADAPLGGGRTVIGAILMLDGVMQAMGVAGMVSTIADRSWRDRGLFLAHLTAGAALFWSGRNLLSNPNLTNLTNPTNLTNLSVFLALLVSLFEATWFNWTDVVIRVIYTVVVLLLLRRTTLPTT
jgi:hypothetical protein